MLAKQENGLKSIISSLSLTPDDCQSIQQAQNVTQFILDWILGIVAMIIAGMVEHVSSGGGG